MANPIVNIDLSSHPYYNDAPHLQGDLQAEVLMININTGSFRCRILKDGEYVKKNVDLGLGYITDKSITINL